MDIYYICKKGDLQQVKEIINNKNINYIFDYCCYFGHLEIVKFLLSLEKTHGKIDIHSNNEDVFRVSCANGHLEIVKLLLNLEKIYDKKFDLLIDIDIEIIKYIMEKLGIKTRTIFSSELHISETGSDRVLNICKAIGCEYYISGATWAKNNLKLEDFAKNNINVRFEEFQHPTYTQCYHPFMPNMAAIDLLFNEGDNSQEKLKNGRNLVIP